MERRRRRRGWVVALAWAAALAASFAVDRWVYRTVSRAYAETTGYEAWRFGLRERGSAPVFEEVFLLLRTMGHFHFAVLATITLLVFQPGRRRQAVLLWVCIGLAALVSQGIVRPLAGKLRPGAPLTEAQMAEVRRDHGPDAVVTYVTRSGRVAHHNTGLALFRARLGAGALGLPSGHATLAFALFAALAVFLPQGRVLFLVLATGVAASRVVMGEHFVSDVVAGAACGYGAVALLTAWPRIRAWAGLEVSPEAS